MWQYGNYFLIFYFMHKNFLNNKFQHFNPKIPASYMLAFFTVIIENYW